MTTPPTITPLLVADLLAEGERMPVYVHVPGDEDYVGIDVFRLDENDKVVENWDVLADSPGRSAERQRHVLGAPARRRPVECSP